MHNYFNQFNLPGQTIFNFYGRVSSEIIQMQFDWKKFTFKIMCIIIFSETFSKHQSLNLKYFVFENLILIIAF